MTTVALAESPIHDLNVRSIFPFVVVCIPAYNEETRIGPVVHQARKFADRVLVCDDGSSDRTSLEAAANGGYVIGQSKNRGKGASLRKLLREAMKMSPDIIVTLDGDGQHDPIDIPKLLTPILDGSADVVIGSRFGCGNRVPFHRRVGNSILTTLTNVTAKTKVRDTQSGFRAYSSKVIPSITITGNGMGVDSEILIRVVKGGFKVVEKEVSVRYEGETSTFNPLSHTLRVVWGLAGAFFEGWSASSSRYSSVPLFLALFALIGLLLGSVMPSLAVLVFALSTLGVGGIAVAAARLANGRLARRVRDVESWKDKSMVS